MIIVDASVAIELLLQTQSAKTIKARLSVPGETLHAPHLLDMEVAHVLRRYVMLGEIDSERGQIALVDFSNMRIRKYAHTFLLSRIWRLRNNLRAYDAVYVALAEALDAPLLTRDRRIANAAGHGALIEVV